MSYDIDRIAESIGVPISIIKGTPGTDYEGRNADGLHGDHSDPELDCKYCGGVAKIVWRKKLFTKPFGTFSIAGAQLKTIASEVDWPWAVCTKCGHESEGKL